MTTAAQLRKAAPAQPPGAEQVEVEPWIGPAAVARLSAVLAERAVDR